MRKDYMKDEVRMCPKCRIQVKIDHQYRPPIGIDPKTEKGTCPDCRVEYYFIPEIKSILEIKPKERRQ